MTGNLVKIDFHGDTLEACQRDGKVWVSLNRLCAAIGVNIEGQRKKLKKEAWATSDIMSEVAEDGKRRDVTVIDLDTLTGWLFTINAGKVKPEIRAKLERYQREAARVLADHFLKRPSPPVSTVPAVPDAGLDARLVHIDLMRSLVVSQIAQERQLADMASHLNYAGMVATAAHDEAIAVRQELAVVRQTLTSQVREANRTAEAAYRHATAGAPAPSGEDPMLYPTQDGLYTVVGWMRANGLRFIRDRRNEPSLAGKRAADRCRKLGLTYRKETFPYRSDRDYNGINVYPPEAIRLAVEGYTTSVFPRGAGPAAAAPALPSNPGVPVGQTNNEPGGV